MNKKDKKIIKIYSDKIIVEYNNIIIPYNITIKEYNEIIKYLVYLTLYKKYYGGDK